MHMFIWNMFIYDMQNSVSNIFCMIEHKYQNCYLSMSSNQFQSIHERVFDNNHGDINNYVW